MSILAYKTLTDQIGKSQDNVNKALKTFYDNSEEGVDVQSMFDVQITAQALNTVTDGASNIVTAMHNAQVNILRNAKG